MATIVIAKERSDCGNLLPLVLKEPFIFLGGGRSPTLKVPIHRGGNLCLGYLIPLEKSRALAPREP